MRHREIHVHAAAAAEVQHLRCVGEEIRRVLHPPAEAALPLGLVALEVDRVRPVVAVAEQQAEVAARIHELLGLPGELELRDRRPGDDGVQPSEVVPLLAVEGAAGRPSRHELPVELLGVGAEREQRARARHEGEHGPQHERRGERAARRDGRTQEQRSERTRRCERDRDQTGVREPVQQHDHQGAAESRGKEVEEVHLVGTLGPRGKHESEEQAHEDVRQRVDDDEREQPVHPARGDHRSEDGDGEPDGASPQRPERAHERATPDEGGGERSSRTEPQHGEGHDQKRGLRKELQRQDHDLQDLETQRRACEQGERPHQERPLPARESRGRGVHSGTLGRPARVSTDTAPSASGRDPGSPDRPGRARENAPRRSRARSLRPA